MNGLTGWVGARVVLVELATDERNRVVGSMPDAEELRKQLSAKTAEGPLVNGLYAITIEDSDETDEALVARCLEPFQ